MPGIRFPERAVAAPLPRTIKLQLARPAPEPPAGDQWVDEIKDDGHRLVAIADGCDALRPGSKPNKFVELRIG
jgi:hypothetical protein